MTWENAKERAVRASFAIGVRFNGVDATLRRGTSSRRLRGFFVDGSATAESKGSVFVATERREFVVEKSAIGALFPPRPRDVFAIDDASGARTFSLYAEAAEPAWFFWNRDKRFVVLRLQEKEGSNV